MATVDFPSSLPLPERTGYGLQHTSTFARTTMASGRAKQRAMFTSVPTAAPVEWILTNSQAQVFEAWFTHGIGNGVAWFNCKLQTPMGLKDYKCQFKAMYEGPELIGVDHWRIRAELEIFERPIFSKEWYLYGLQFIEYSSIIDQAMNREWPKP